MNPSVGRIVHYVSYGTPHGEFESMCRAAIVAGLTSNPDDIELVVLNPTGLFFNTSVYSAGKEGGTWHWPERED